jgi:hypothetical protein
MTKTLITCPHCRKVLTINVKHKIELDDENFINTILDK